MLPEGAKVTEVSFPYSAQTVFLSKLSFLDNAGLTLPSNAALRYLYVVDCVLLDPLAIAEDALEAQGSVLSHATLAWVGSVNGDADTADLIMALTGLLGKVVYEDGGIIPREGKPFVEGLVRFASGLYADDISAFDLEDETVIADNWKEGISKLFDGGLRIQYNPAGVYIRFVDAEVQRICIETWGDGSGITMGQAEAVTDLSTYFRGNTLIETFDELGAYFIGLTSIYGNSSSPYGAFAGCTALTSITLPESITSIGNSAFRGCSALQHLGIPHKSITVNQYSFYGCTSLVDLYCPGTPTNYTLYNTGNGTGTLYVRGNANMTNGFTRCSFRHIIIQGGASTNATTGRWFTNADSYTETLRVYGNCELSSSGNILRTNSNGSATRPLKFGELLGTAGNSAGRFCTEACLHSGFIMHLGYLGVACLPTFISASSVNVSKIYVGPGESQAGDQAILDQYLADEAWAEYSDKLDLWYNYDGEYKTPPTIPT